jgi:hypothetical protein
MVYQTYFCTINKLSGQNKLKLTAKNFVIGPMLFEITKLVSVPCNGISSVCGTIYKMLLWVR